MELSNMTFEEFLFNGRYHIIGGIIFLVFVGGFVREIIAELMARKVEHRERIRNLAFGPIFQDSLLGQTMADGGEPVDQPGDARTD